MRWSEDQLQNHLVKARTDSSTKPGVASSKHRNQKIVENGVTFGSKLEYARAKALQQLQAAGAISDLRFHTEWPLIVNGHHVATWIDDANYLQDGLRVIEDSKGRALPEYVIKSKLFHVLYAPLKIIEITSTRRKRRGSR